MIKLTKRNVDALTPRQKQYVEYDTDLTGFGVAVYASGIKSWICEYRPHGGGRGVPKKRVTLGKVTQLTAEQARKTAADMLAAVRLGGDPALEKAERRASVTVGELTDLFDAQYVATMLKPGTAVSHRIALEESSPRALGAIGGGGADSALTLRPFTCAWPTAPTRPIAPPQFGPKLSHGRLQGD